MNAALSDEDLRTALTAKLVAAEFRDMPGLRLTEAQMKRLWHLSTDECLAVLEQLVESRFLIRDDSGLYGLPCVESSGILTGGTRTSSTRLWLDDDKRNCPD